MKPNLSKPTVTGLAYILRHKEEWPDNFEWDFSHHRGCALEIINATWVGGRDIVTIFDAASLLGIPNFVAAKIFLESGDREEVSPEHIATALEAL